MSTGEQETQVVAPQGDEDTTASFASGFDDEGPGEQLPAPEAEVKPEDEAAAAAAVETPPAKPEQVTLTREEFDKLNQRLESFNGVTEDMRKVHGKIGELNRTNQQLHQMLQEVTKATGNGAQKLSQVQLKRLSEAYPEMARLLTEDLHEVGTEPSAAQAAPGGDEVQKLIQEAVKASQTESQAELRKVERKLLTRDHADWETVVRSQDFQTWIGGRPEKDEFNNSWDSDYVGKVLTAFKVEQKAKTDAAAKAAAEAEAAAKAAAQPSNKTKRLAAAVQPSGVSSQGAPQLSEKDLFRSGFQTG